MYPGTDEIKPIPSPLSQLLYHITSIPHLTPV